MEKYKTINVDVWNYWKQDNKWYCLAEFTYTNSEGQWKELLLQEGLI